MGPHVHAHRRQRSAPRHALRHVRCAPPTRLLHIPVANPHTEFADVTEQVLDKLALAKLLSAHPTILPYFRSLSLTDQPRERPALPLPAAAREKHLILTLAAPPPTAAADTLPFITALFPFVDALTQGKITLRPETKLKLRKAREDVDKLIKEDAEKEQKEDVRSPVSFIPRIDH